MPRRLLQQSGVQQIDSGAFKDLPNLYELYLGTNGITDIGGNPFQNLSSLATLDLNRNGLSVIENTTFAGLPNLFTLDLDVNNIAVIQPNSFFHLTNLVILKLSYNKISEIKKDYFNGLYNIQEILMPGNKLSFVEEETFQDMTNLTVLTLDVHCDCNIKAFRNWLNFVYKNESTVKCIDLDDALLTSLPSCFFDKCNGPQCSTIVCNQNMCYYNYTGEVICRNDQDIMCTGKYI
ncbi:insulin-like growth factor-binding protein complex acid labile subunit [Mytilus galloprovincialis]|uniref:Insulin-like growth factor-binding protein complex acid labile subunit n=2 Tax=Mytilus galloprovincialis TaxID=29158 RepID=A0A8B6BKK6_MYTGA|nr:insulin-like growth factor-binding protein complex acid labile subunit [Mytilus galloprovincialis]